MKTALFIGRFAPAHKGHVSVIMRLLETYDRVVIGLGSCYDVGSRRAPLLAVFREKMLLLSIYNNGGDMNKLKIVHMQDYDTFEEWLDDVLLIGKEYKVTHFISNNHKDILDVLKAKKIELPFEIVDPEKMTQFRAHATDLRRAVVDGDYEKYLSMAASGTRLLMPSFDGFNRIRICNDNKGRKLFKGRQSVDVVFTIQEKVKTPSGKVFMKTYVLCGIRPQTKIDFPGYLGIPGTQIINHESPTDAAIRALNEKASIHVNMISNLSEPAVISIHTDKGIYIGALGFLQMYNKSELAGKFGGSSQCFYINMICSHTVFNKILKQSNFKFIPIQDCLEQPMAYQHKEMVQDGFHRLSQYAE